MFGCLFSLSLKCCLTASIYDNRPLTVYRNNRTVTRRAESLSLLQPYSSFCFLVFSFFFTRKQESQPPVDPLTLGRAAWAVRLVVESRGGLSNVTETHDWKEEMADTRLPLLTQNEWGQDSANSSSLDCVVTLQPLLLLMWRNNRRTWRKCATCLKRKKKGGINRDLQ